MKALSLTRPWPYAILHLGKRLENRSRRDGRMPAICHHRGPLLLHAAKSWDDEAGPAMVAAGLVHRDRLLDVFRDRDDFERNPAGAIVGRCNAVAHLAPSGEGWVTFDEHYDTRDLDLRWWFGGYALVLADVEPTPVVPCRGALGVWTVPDDVIERLAKGSEVRS